MMSIFIYFFKLNDRGILVNLYDVFLFPFLPILIFKHSKRRGGISIPLLPSLYLICKTSKQGEGITIPLPSHPLFPHTLYSTLPSNFQKHFTGV